MKQREQRRAFLDEILVAIPVEPFTVKIAQVAGRIDAEIRRQGRIIPTADLQIGTTALYHRNQIVTLNVRHFAMIPGLRVRQL